MCIPDKKNIFIYKVIKYEPAERHTKVAGRRQPLQRQQQRSRCRWQPGYSSGTPPESWKESQPGNDSSERFKSQNRSLNDTASVFLRKKNSPKFYGLFILLTRFQISGTYQCANVNRCLLSKTSQKPLPEGNGQSSRELKEGGKKKQVWLTNCFTKTQRSSCKFLQRPSVFQVNIGKNNNNKNPTLSVL